MKTGFKIIDSMSENQFDVFMAKILTFSLEYMRSELAEYSQEDYMILEALEEIEKEIFP